MAKVDDRTRLVDESGHVLQNTVVDLKKATNMVAEFAASIQEQTSAIEQVNKAMLSKDKIMQQNAALVEEANVAAKSLNEQATCLNQLMPRFRVDTSAASSRRVASASLGSAT